MSLAATLRTIAVALDHDVAEREAGHETDPDTIRTAARRLRAQAEMVEEGLAE